MPDLNELKKAIDNLKKTSKKDNNPEVQKETPKKDKEQTFSEKKDLIGNMAVKSKNLEVIPEKTFKAEIDKLFKECKENAKPLEALRSSLEDDNIFIASTIANLKKQNKFTPEKEKEYNAYKENTQARKKYIDQKIKQFREENRGILDKNSVKGSMNKKLDEASLEDAKALQLMLKEGKPLSSMVIIEPEESKDMSNSAGNSALLSAIQGFNKANLKRSTSRSNQIQNDRANKQPERKLSAKIGSMTNPYQEILDLRGSTAELKLNQKSTRELKEIKTKIPTLKAQLLTEISFAKDRKVDSEIIEAKQSQINQLNKVSKVLDNVLSSRREDEREKSDIVSEIKKQVEKLSIEELTVMNKLLGNIGNKKLAGMIDLTGSQKYIGDTTPSTSTKHKHATMGDTSSFLNLRREQEEGDHKLAIKLQEKYDRKYAKGLQGEINDGELALKLQEKEDRGIAKKLQKMYDKSSHYNVTSDNADKQGNIPSDKNFNYFSSSSILALLLRIGEYVLDIAYPKINNEIGQKDSKKTNYVDKITKSNEPENIKPAPQNVR